MIGAMSKRGQDTNVMSFPMLSCSHFSHFSNFLSDPIGQQGAMSKRGQEAISGEGSPMVKPKQWFQRRRDKSTWFLRSPWSARECR